MLPACVTVDPVALDQEAADLILAQVEASKCGEERDQSWIRLSSAGSCPREIGYRLTNSPGIPDSPASLVVFEVGHAIHARVQSWLVALGWLRPELVEVPLLLPSARVRGTPDGVTERLTAAGFPRPDGTRRVVEIKSIGNQPGEVFGNEVAGAFDRLKEPKEHHIDQATAYAWLWNTLLEEGSKSVLHNWLHPAWYNRGHAPEGNGFARLEPWVPTWPEDRVTHLTFVYVAKDGSDQDMPLKVFTQKVSEKRTERLVGKFAEIWRAVDDGGLPPRLKDAFGRYSPCGWCPFRDLCLEGLVNEEAADEEAVPVLDEEEAGAGSGDPGRGELEDEPVC